MAIPILAFLFMLLPLVRALQTPTGNPFSFLFNQKVVSSSSESISILVCPAQFCVPLDYEVLFRESQKRTGRESGGGMPRDSFASHGMDQSGQEFSRPRTIPTGLSKTTRP
jgi:hypothetical protein